MFVSFSFFFVTTSMNAVNRAVLYIPIELIQQNVNILDVNDESDLYFNKSDLKTDLDKYFQNYPNDSAIFRYGETEEERLGGTCGHHGLAAGKPEVGD